MIITDLKSCTHLGNANFRVLPGDIELGPQRPELYQVAATQDEQVNVTNDRQTIVVMEGVNIRLDWSTWASEVLANFSSSNVTYSVHRSRINESGYAIGPPEIVMDSNPPERIVVELDDKRNEFYVEVACIALGDQNGRTSDSGVYELEACAPEGDECVNSNITVYVIEKPPPLGSDVQEECMITVVCIHTKDDTNIYFAELKCCPTEDLNRRVMIDCHPSNEVVSQTCIAESLNRNNIAQ